MCDNKTLHCRHGTDRKTVQVLFQGYECEQGCEKADTFDWDDRDGEVVTIIRTVC